MSWVVILLEETELSVSGQCVWVQNVFILFSLCTDSRHPVSDTAKQSHNITEPPLYFTVGILFFSLKTSFFFLCEHRCDVTYQKAKKLLFRFICLNDIIPAALWLHFKMHFRNKTAVSFSVSLRSSWIFFSGIDFHSDVTFPPHLQLKTKTLIFPLAPHPWLAFNFFPIFSDNAVLAHVHACGAYSATNQPLNTWMIIRLENLWYLLINHNYYYEKTKEEKSSLALGNCIEHFSVFSLLYTEELTGKSILAQ